MAKGTPGKRVEATLRTLVLMRPTRVGLHERLVEGVRGVDATTYPVLAGLAASGPCTATQLAVVVGLDRTVTTRYLSRLEEAGLVARAPDPSDGRATRVELTAAGTAAVATMRRRLRDMVDSVLDHWPKRDAQRFAAALERFSRELGEP